MMAIWRRLPRREQWALTGLGIALLMYIAWFTLLQPLREAVLSQQRQVAMLSEDLTEVQRLSAALTQARGQRRNLASPAQLPQLLDQSLRSNGMRMGSYQPAAGGEVSLRLDSVGFDALLQWLFELEFQHGVEVRELSISARGEPGQVAAQLRVRGGGG